MSDFAYQYNEELQHCDLVLGNYDLETGDDLYTAMLISLMSDRVADTNWTYTLDPKGWWADANRQSPLGSRLWQLFELPVTDSAEYIIRAQSYANEALQWLTDDSVAKSVESVATVSGQDLYLTITVTKADNTSQEYSYVWNNLGVIK